MRRFPRSTMILMIVILVGVALTSEKATAVQMRYEGVSTTSVWNTLPASFWDLTSCFSPP
jgi:hypothetical protein